MKQQRLLSFVVVLVICVASIPVPHAAQIIKLDAGQQLLHDIYQQLIEINTTDSVGDCTAAANAMADRLRAAGFPGEDIKVLGPHPRKGNLIARLHRTGARKPVLLLAHIDVVEAKREDWSFDPFKLLEKTDTITAEEPPTTKRWPPFSLPT
jgi:acetylornithine deacetylase/succinyl-diaminopimelate desuccinylase-like protein